MAEKRQRPLIMVVDDESHILHVVSMKLRNAGYDVITAQDGEEALDLAVRDKPDLIITDLQMPIMNGLELCYELKSKPETVNTPVLMLTARGYSLTSDDLRRTNIADVLSKPFSPREVLEHVQELISTEITQRL